MGSAGGSSRGFNRLIRFKDHEGKICYGDLPPDCQIIDAVGTKVMVLDGNPFDGFKESHTGTEVTKVGERPWSIFQSAVLQVKSSEVTVAATYASIAVMPARINASHSLHWIELSTACK